jgi:hypothetical protein
VTQSPVFSPKLGFALSSLEDDSLLPRRTHKPLQVMRKCLTGILEHS